VEATGALVVPVRRGESRYCRGPAAGL